MLKRTLLLLILITALTACSGPGELEITNLRANLTLPTDTGAVYLTITNHTSEDEALLGASIPGCGAAELHEMTMTDGVMQMHQVEGGVIPIPAGAMVELKQGSLHVMCLGKTGEFTVGDMVIVTLEFEKAGTLRFDAEIIAP